LSKNLHLVEKISSKNAKCEAKKSRFLKNLGENIKILSTRNLLYQEFPVSVGKCNVPSCRLYLTHRCNMFILSLANRHWKLKQIS